MVTNWLKKNPQFKIPDSEIKIENIIPDSPIYIPYKKPKVVSKGNNSKRIKLPKTNNKSTTGMAHTKQMLTIAEREAMEAQNKRAENRAKWMSEEAAVMAQSHPHTKAL